MLFKIGMHITDILHTAVVVFRVVSVMDIESFSLPDIVGGAKKAEISMASQGGGGGEDGDRCRE